MWIKLQAQADVEYRPLVSDVCARLNLTHRGTAGIPSWQGCDYPQYHLIAHSFQ